MPSPIPDIREATLRLRDALLAPGPEAMESQIPALEAAVEALRQVTVASPELQALKADLQATARLIESGQAFHDGWARLLGSASGGYTSSGGTPALSPRPSLFLEG